MIRFTNDEVINSLNEVIQKIKSELHAEEKDSPFSDDVRGLNPAINSPFRGLGGFKDTTSELEMLATQLLNPLILLDLIVNYTVFEEEEKKDLKT